jgi:hypothetical protein
LGFLGICGKPIAYNDVARRLKIAYQSVVGNVLNPYIKYFLLGVLDDTGCLCLGLLLDMCYLLNRFQKKVPLSAYLLEIV